MHVQKKHFKVKKAVIPVAGLGTRFLPVTKSIPKEMIPIIDTPVIQYIIQEAVDSGIEEVIFITSKNKEAIENYLDHHELLSYLKHQGKTQFVEILESIKIPAHWISVRQSQPLGLGHAILCAEPWLNGEPFAVLLGDDLMDAKVPCLKQMMDLFAKEQVSILGVVQVLDSQVDKYGIIEGEPMGLHLTRVHQMIEKPQLNQAPSNLAIAGRYLLTPAIFQQLKKVQPGQAGEIQLTDALQYLVKQETILAYELQGVRYDTGDRIGFIDATLAYALKRSDLAEEVSQLMRKYLGLQKK